MNIEAGKKYITRAGDVVKIVLNHNYNSIIYPFWGSNRKLYRDDGIYRTETNADKDIVAPLYTIKDLAEGRVVVKNDGSMEDLNKVLKAAFPDDLNKAPEGWKFFGKSFEVDEKWDGWRRTNLPIQSVKYFLMQLDEAQEEPKQQEKQEEKEKTTIEKIAELLGLEHEIAQDKTGAWIEFKDRDHAFYLNFSGDGNTFEGMTLAKKEWQVVDEFIVITINKTP